MWTNYCPVSLVAGLGVAQSIVESLPVGNRLLLTTQGAVTRGMVSHLLEDEDSALWTTKTISPNPDIGFLDSLSFELKSSNFSCIVAVGGGSVIDSAKVLSVTIPADEPGVLLSWLRQGAKPEFPSSIPVFCAPTTAGTGAEVTPFATVWDKACEKKYSLTGRGLFPRMSYLDHSLTVSLPWQETLYSGLDALSHSFETLWNKNSTPITETYALKAIELIVEYLPRLKENPNDLEARYWMLSASLLAGLAISQNRTAIAHAISYQFTLRWDVPHGLACSFTLPAIIELVERHGAWRSRIPVSVLDRARQFFRDINLVKHVTQYCSIKDLDRCPPNALGVERAGNFVITLDSKAQRQLLEKSMSYQN
jgi:alcohol dehydrogenase